MLLLSPVIAHSVMDIATIGECAEKNQPSTNPNMNVSLTFSICKAIIKYLDMWNCLSSAFCGGNGREI